MDKGKKPAGIKDVARVLGISIATVDRAFHNRPGVNPKTRARVLAMAQKLNYRPNIAARNLKLNRRLSIAVYLPEQIRSFFTPLLEGVRSAADAVFGVEIDVEYRTYPRMGEGDLALLESIPEGRFDGVIFTPGDPLKFEPVINRLSRSGTAMVCVATDAPHSERIAAVSVDAYVSGALAAELLGRTMQRSASIAMITGELHVLDHAEKLRGFAANLALLAPHLSLLPAVESHESAQEALRQTRNLLKRHPDVGGIYVSTANSLPVLRVLEEQHLLGKIQVLCTDLFPELIPLLESGRILGTLYQRPFAQGKTAFEILLRYLVERVRPEHATRLAPHMIFRSNLPLFADRVRSKARAAAAPEARSG
jgi:LacI family transcriptional regulator